MNCNAILELMESQKDFEDKLKSIAKYLSNIDAEFDIYIEKVCDYGYVMDYKRMFNSENVAKTNPHDIQMHRANFMRFMPSQTEDDLKVELGNIIVAFMQFAISLCYLHEYTDFKQINERLELYRIQKIRNPYENIGVRRLMVYRALLDKFNKDVFNNFLLECISLCSDLGVELKSKFMDLTTQVFYIGE